jgi:hypothetical protein
MSLRWKDRHVAICHPRSSKKIASIKQEVLWKTKSVNVAFEDYLNYVLTKATPAIKSKYPQGNNSQITISLLQH